jgi:cytochrome c oxidase subunit 1
VTSNFRQPTAYEQVRHAVETGVLQDVDLMTSIRTSGLNFIITIHRMRCPGMTWFRLPLFVWSHYAASIRMVLATPELCV